MRPDRGHLDRLGRQRLGDLGEQPAGDQGRAVASLCTSVPTWLDTS